MSATISRVVLYLGFLATWSLAKDRELLILDSYDRVNLFVCEQDGDKIIEKLQFKDNKRLDKVKPDHYRHNLFRPIYDKSPIRYRVCIVFQRGDKKRHESKIVWIRNSTFSIDGFGERSIHELINEIEDKAEVSRIREALKNIPFD